MKKSVSHGSLYHNLDRETIDFLHRVGEVREYEKDDVIFLESDEAYHFFLILDGCVKISRLSRDGKEVMIALLSTGNFFGDMALLDGFPRSADVMAERKSKILSIHEKDFYYLLENTPRLATELLKELAHRIRNSDSQIKGLSLLNARGKVASALLRWVQDQGIFREKFVEITGIPKQQEMANYIGLSRETFNRILGEMEHEGFLEKPSPHTIIIRNYQEFTKIFGPVF